MIVTIIVYATNFNIIKAHLIKLNHSLTFLLKSSTEIDTNCPYLFTEKTIFIY